MTEFSIAGKGLKFDSAEDIQKYVDELKALKNVTSINLMGNTYGVEASKALAEGLKNQAELETINLSDMFTGRLVQEIPEALDALLQALLTCPKLHTVDLSDNAFGIMTIDPLEKFLSKHVPLENLILANNGFGPAAGTRIANALAKLADTKKEAGNDSKLATVICGRNRLEDGSMEAWAKLLCAHGTIKDLRLPQNGIRKEGIEHLLLHGLSHTPAIEKLDLQDNTFTVRGGRALAKVVSNWPAIRDLGISDCLLSAEGAELFADALLELDPILSLESLRLQYNEIEAPGVAKLVKAIELKAPNLKFLELNGNKFPEDHDVVDTINALFEDRGYGELDELDDMEEETDDEDEEDEDEEEKPSKEVDELAEDLSKTSI